MVIFIEVALNAMREPADPAIEIDPSYNYAGEIPSLCHACKRSSCASFALWCPGAG
jgi:hypothetical protein